MLEETQTTESTEEKVNHELSVSDLHSLRAIIDLASTRGAFKAGELAAVGQAYNKLSGFLEAISKQSEGK
jgi:hypothetical protein